MNCLVTPLGEIEILVDGEKILYNAQEGSKLERLCPDVLGRYHIEIQYTPDGNKHSLNCVIKNKEKFITNFESGENLECQGFYSQNRVKLSIGLIGEVRGYVDGKLTDCNNDYDIDYLEKGMAYIVLEETKTDKYIFGISWIDDVGWDDPRTEEYQKREIETWFGADPNFNL